MADQIIIQFSTAAPSSFIPFTKGFRNRYSKAIRMAGHTYFSHVDFILRMSTVAEWLGLDPIEAHAKWGDYACLGASNNPKAPVIAGSPRGVAIRTFDYQSFGIRRQMIIRTDRADAVLAFARDQIGKPFDSGALSPKVFLSDPFYGEVESRDWRNPDIWFCAEYHTCSLEDGFFWGIGEKVPIKKNRVTPEDLHMVLMMDPRVINRRTFLNPIPTILMGPYEI